MDRRSFGKMALGLAAAPLAHAQEQSGPPSRYEASWESIRRHPVPDWFNNAKLGIFIHWGLYSVPAWAPPTGELGKVDWNKWFYQNPYAEWYLNTIRLKESASYKHHVTTYGANFDYYDFAKDFNKGVASWKPGEWASLFRKTGARYVVLTTKHHDGFTLWPSKVKNPNRPNGPFVERDLVGDLTKAVTGAGMKMGLYYSGGLDWTFSSDPIARMADLRTTAPQSEQYAAYADAHWQELIERYRTAVLWNDITYPKLGKLPEIFSKYYNEHPEGIVNNRFGVDFSDFTTPEYTRYEKIVDKKWESCRGLGFSFGYNRVEGPEHVLASGDLVRLLIDIVSKNGNLLLNIGPRPDGSISELQLDRLNALGRWLDVNGEGIFDTKPWVRSSAKEGDADVRFTRKGDSVYAFLLNRSAAPNFTIPRILAAEGSKLQMLGVAGDLSWSQKGHDLEVKAPGRLPGEYATAVKITPVPWQLVKE
ncbi:MAG: alpha-L-fucosidase [Bryobacteraceae bacterium]|nr:alpha-L-fucosidase [Bryobacteraceae bacterium]